MIYMKINVFLYVYINIHMFILLSSPYLFVFSDDRVRGTREQMMLMQVVLWSLAIERGYLGRFYYFMVLK